MNTNANLTPPVCSRMVGRHMKSDGIFRHAALAFVVALILYAIAYTGIEHRRTRNGPWQVAFTTASGAPAIVINQPALAITNVQIVFTDAASPATNVAPDFAQPRPVPFAV